MLKLSNDARFSNKDIIVFFLPVLFEQLMVAGLSVADTFMVSFLGDTAVAGVSLVSRIDNFAKQFFLALAQGGSIVLAQYIGADNTKSASVSLKNNLRIVVGIGAFVMLVMVVFKTQVLKILFGGAEPAVLSYSKSYFTITAFSYPFTALYYTCSSCFRAMGESKIPFVSSVFMMLINLVLKYIFIFVFDFGVKGAALSTLLAMLIVGVILLIMLYSHSNNISLRGFFNDKLDFDNIKRILYVSVPNGIEQGMFQLGALAIAGLVSGLGETAIAADSVARSVSPLIHSTGAAFNATIMIVVGQCMGAKSPEDAKFYTKHILKMDYIFTFLNALVFVALLHPVIEVFRVSDSVKQLSFMILLIYTAGSIIMYPSSFAMAAALRGTGDTRFVMVVSASSMFLFRIGAAYIFVHLFDMGVIGTWVAMVSDWFIRSIVFAVRFIHGRWQKNKVV